MVVRGKEGCDQSLHTGAKLSTPVPMACHSAGAGAEREREQVMGQQVVGFEECQWVKGSVARGGELHGMNSRGLWAGSEFVRER